ncbi:MAG: PA0069 family radical SAM protein [Hyphomicrobiaceae bacterium]
MQRVDARHHQGEGQEAQPLHGTPIAETRRHGRGSRSNRSGRYEPLQAETVDDGWRTIEDLPPFRTDVTEERARTIITTNTSPDISFDQSINPYRGCEHGCSYCYARPSHAYMGHSPGLDFETRLYVKPNAAALLEREIAASGYVPRTIALGTNTDPYQPIERNWRVTRAILEVLEAARHPVGIVTKSALVLRDIDILVRMARDGLSKVAISVTTLDRAVSRSMEPRASTPRRRLEAIARLAEAGIPASVMVAPIVPAINDHEIERILGAAAAAGASEAGYVLLRLPLEIKDLFREWLATEFPDRAKRVVALMRSMRGGRDYDARWFERQRGRGPYAEQIAQRFKLALRQNRLNERRLTLRTDLFRPPVPAGGQIPLL